MHWHCGSNFWFCILVSISCVESQIESTQWVTVSKPLFYSVEHSSFSSYFNGHGLKYRHRPPSYWRRQDKQKHEFKLKQEANSSNHNQSKAKVNVAAEESLVPTCNTDIVVEVEVTNEISCTDSENLAAAKVVDIQTAIKSKNNQPKDDEAPEDLMMTKDEVENFKNDLMEKFQKTLASTPIFTFDTLPTWSL